MSQNHSGKHIFIIFFPLSTLLYNTFCTLAHKSCPTILTPCSCCKTAPPLAGWWTAARIPPVHPGRASPPSCPQCSWRLQRRSGWVCRCCPRSSRRSTGILGCWRASRCFWWSSCLLREQRQPARKPESTSSWRGRWTPTRGSSRRSGSALGSEGPRWSGWRWRFGWGLNSERTVVKNIGRKNAAIVKSESKKEKGRKNV